MCSLFSRALYNQKNYGGVKADWSRLCRWRPLAALARRACRDGQKCIGYDKGKGHLISQPPRPLVPSSPRPLVSPSLLATPETWERQRRGNPIDDMVFGRLGKWAEPAI